MISVSRILAALFLQLIQTRVSSLASQFWRQAYLMTVLSLILAVFCAQVHPRYLSNDWRWIRTAIFCCVAGISVIPACHWVWLNGGFTADVVQVRRRFCSSVAPSSEVRQNLVSPSLCAQLFLPRVIVMYLIAGSALMFYVTKIPERYFPGESVCV